MNDAATTVAFPIEQIRRQFPALNRQVGSRAAAFFDGPAGSQTPQSVIDAISDYLIHHNANHGGQFATSIESDAMLDEAHRAVADLLGTDDPECVIFGANMTTLAFALSRSLAKTWRPGDEILVSDLDHDANVTPWVMAAADAGATVKRIAIRPDDCTLDLDDLRTKLSWRTKLVAVGCASNAVGTVNPVGRIVEMAHAYGAEVFLDAVHFAPHGLLDVAVWDCDFLACSAYKFFGPHVGILWGKRDRLESLPVYKVRPSTNDLPGKWMTGTQNHECIAGTLAAIEYLASLGRQLAPNVANRRDALKAAFTGIGRYEATLGARLLTGLKKIEGVRVYGIVDSSQFGERVPTISFTHNRMIAAEIAANLGKLGIFAWHGNYYALPLTESLGLEPNGMVRVGALHYNTVGEVDRLLESLARVFSTTTPVHC